MALFRTNQHEDYTGEFKLPIKFDITMLNMFIGYIFKKNSVNITRKSLSIMRKLFSVIDEVAYENEPQSNARVQFIKAALDAKLDRGFENYDAIVNFCRSDTYDASIEEIIKNLDIYTKINYEEIKYINRCVEDRLKYYYILVYKDHFISAFEKIDSGEYKTFSEINSEIGNLCTKYITRSRAVKSFDSTNTFSLDDENFDDNVIDVASRLKNPKRVLRTGIQYLNELLSPGFLSDRVYVFMATAGGGKSSVLLKVARDIRKYNQGLVSDKCGKRPCVLYLTMENNIDETIERLFNMTSSFSDIRDYTPKQVLKMLKDSGEFTLTDTNNINLVIRYEHNRAISTEDLYTIIDDMSDSGNDVIALVLDYLKRIRPAEPAKEEKTELKNITNELKTLATEKSIPIITAHQLNRAAASTIDAAIQANKTDLARFVGAANVGTAWEIVENADWMCVINKEMERSTGQLFMTFKRIKLRYKASSDMSYFNHPFENNNEMRLIDDLDLDAPKSVINLGATFDAAPDTKQGKRHAKEREEIGDDSIFDFDASLNK